ncbi:hypothetical protein HanPI659440_Chr07g0267181 [Helianthus annuus]|nr:hypothetical protein HanPI659440_Chr07g0267181 [Helianthus annuus]
MNASITFEDGIGLTVVDEVHVSQGSRDHWRWNLDFKAGLNKWYAKAFEGVVFMAGSKVRRWFDHEEEHRMDLQVRLILLAIN